MHRNECDFPECHLEINSIGAKRCLIHKDVRISGSYMNATEVEDDEY